MQVILNILIYIDPGTGSIILQALVATIVGAGITFKLFWHRIKMNVFLPFYRFFSSLITKAWWKLPLSRQNKELLKTGIFSVFPYFFYKSRVYRNWKYARFHANVKSENLISIAEEQNVSASVNEEVRKSKELTENFGSIYSVAIVIHVFYYEIFLEIMDYIKKIKSVNFTLYVTSPPELSEKIINTLENVSYKYRILPIENHGRDILPFLKMIPLAFNDGHQLILKIHTKKSDHRQTGSLWRNDIFKKLLTENAMTKAINLFNTDKSIGIMGASGHIVPMSLYYGANAQTLERLSHQLGIASSQLANLTFAAGSMFYVRQQALLPLLSLGLKSEDFEKEEGQNDGALAHAVERAFAVSALAAGLKLVDHTYEFHSSNINVTKDHPFTN